MTQNLHQKTLAILILAMTFTLHLKVQSQTVKDVITKYQTASGFEKRKDIKTITSIGKLTQMGSTLPISIIQKMPDQYRMDVHLPGARVTQAYNGRIGWTFNPFMQEDTMLLTGAELDQIKESSDFLGILNTYQLKGYKLEMAGSETVDGIRVFKLHMVKPDKQELFFFIDQKSYWIIKTEAHLNIEGLHVVAESWFSDYRLVDGILFPYRIKNRTGMMVTEIAIDTVRLNERLDDPLFNYNQK